jgi:hypothetical protein
MLGGDPVAPDRTQATGVPTPPSGEHAARPGTAEPDESGSGEDTPPSGFPRATGWGAPPRRAEATTETQADATGRNRPGAHEAD